MRDELIDTLLSLNLNNPTRNAVRKHISEYDYLREFGTFTEFKRQAGLLNLKSHNKYNNAVANYASGHTPAINNVNLDKQSYGDKYLRPDSKRFQTVMVCSDVHAHLCDEFTRCCFLDTTRRVQPEIIVIAGDLWNFNCFSSYTKDPRDVTLLEELTWVHKFLKALREINPNAQITITEGNHDFRLLKNIAEETPFVQILLHEFNGFTISKLLRLDEYEINYVAKGDLSVYKESDIKREVSKNFITLFDTVVIGHFPEIKHYGMPSYNGHHHTYIAQPNYNITYGAYYNIQLGCMSKLDASYCNPSKWTQGFCIINIDTHNKRVANDYIDLSNEFAMIAGQFYERAIDM
jgi:hypothetical protein